MTQPSTSYRPGPGQWILLLVMAAWLAIVPLCVVLVLDLLNDGLPAELAQLGMVAVSTPHLGEPALGLLATVITFLLQLLVFVPLLLATRKPQQEFLHTLANLLVAIALIQSFSSLARLPWLQIGSSLPDVGPTLSSVLKLGLILPFLLVGLGSLEARRYGRTLVAAWQRVGLRMWHTPAAMWLALGAAAVIVWPWVLVGSLGSAGTTAANALQALPNALGEEILFRGFAFAWMWRAARSRGGGAVASLILFIAAQGGTALPGGDWAALARFPVALFLGVLTIELTIRAGGSIWPAVVVHFLYDWFPLAFADPRSREEVLHWLALAWMPLAAGGTGFMLWLGSVARRDLGTGAARRPARSKGLASAGLAGGAWIGILVLYFFFGVPGFHPDGFLIILEEQADLRAAAGIADPVERRSWVYERLVETAESSQAPVRAELERRGLPYRPHYLANVIEVQARPGLRRTFGKMEGVDSVQFQPGMRRYARTFSLPDMDPRGASGVEWNISEIGADQVWALGYTGQGVIVGDADTGVDWQHPALMESYLGWDGAMASHDYHWYDAWDGLAEPWDDNGHGTHTTGTVVGSDGENQIGVAPGARWIACRNMRHGVGNPGGYLSCMEFLLAPFPLAGDPFRDGNPARGAQVVNNSWGCPREEGCLPNTLRAAVENLRAAGQMMVVSAGNDGPFCGTVQDPPAIYDEVYSVGAITSSDQAAEFSSRGPVTVDASHLPKPDIVAPGVDIRSSIPDGYASLPGTSMAGPHVAGAVALLWSMEPSLIGDVERTSALLNQTAQRLTVDAVCAAEGVQERGTVCGCANDRTESVPNQVYGWGQVDVWVAAQAILEGP